MLDYFNSGLLWPILEPLSSRSTYKLCTCSIEMPTLSTSTVCIRVAPMLMVLIGHQYNDDFNSPISNGVERADFFNKPFNICLLLTLTLIWKLSFSLVDFLSATEV